MAWLSNPSLVIEPITDHPGRRRVCINVDITCEPGDADRDDLSAAVVVHAIDEHDAPVSPGATPILSLARRLEPVSQHLSVEKEVDRVDLDVEQDWWASGPGGETEPIAEWVDHVVADVTLTVGGCVVAQARTPTVSGSWGALGRD